jgi:hypothetical protein
MGRWHGRLCWASQSRNTRHLTFSVFASPLVVQSLVFVTLKVPRARRRVFAVPTPNVSTNLPSSERLSHSEVGVRLPQCRARYTHFLPPRRLLPPLGPSYQLSTEKTGSHVSDALRFIYLIRPTGPSPAGCSAAGSPSWIDGSSRVQARCWMMRPKRPHAAFGSRFLRFHHPLISNGACRFPAPSSRTRRHRQGVWTAVKASASDIKSRWPISCISGGIGVSTAPRTGSGIK